MNDRELLELAAKAAGILNAFAYDAEGRELESWWNPLTDDGDALRLAVTLGVCVDTRAADGDIDVWGQGLSGRLIASEPHGDDKYAATRSAIVRAAAEIGRAMP